MSDSKGVAESIPPILRPDRVSPVAFNDFAAHFSLTQIAPGEEVWFTGISMNTADLRPGDLFVALPGAKSHGASHLAKAISLGAVALLTDDEGLALLGSKGAGLPTLRGEALRHNLGDWAAYVYGNFSEVMPKLFATTGTNGKTSTSYLLEAMLRQLGEVTGLTSTAERHIAGEVIVSRLTTPETTEMNALMARMREKGVTAVAVEVSAQALSQHRVDGLLFDIAAFTNLSHDHLDDYADMAEYLRAKAELFTARHAKRAVISLDTDFGAQLAAVSQIPFVTFSSRAGVAADYRATVTEEAATHTAFDFEDKTGRRLSSKIPILGAHMAANAGLAIAMLLEAGYRFERIAEALKDGVDAYLPGRTERVSGERGPNVFVDFGHSPDAFEKTLSAVRKVTPGRVIMVFGADGDRDPSKRPDMARVAAEGCDLLVITDHHPRFEDPASIRKVLVDSARKARPELEIFEVSPPEPAIRKAVSLAREGDSILWAGPGHQDYRDIRGVRTPYSARAEARAALREAGWL